MKPTLTRITSTLYHVINGVRVKGPHSRIRGDVTGIRGDVTGITGDVTGITGNLDDCDLTAGERASGVDIATLIRP